jgi:hypothetical protein
LPLPCMSVCTLSPNSRLGSFSSWDTLMVCEKGRLGVCECAGCVCLCLCVRVCPHNNFSKCEYMCVSASVLSG